MTNKKNLGVAGLVILAIIAGVIIYRDSGVSKIEITDNSTSAENSLKNSGIEMTGDGKIEVIPMPENNKKLPPAPTLIRSTNFPNTLSEQGKKVAITNIEKAVEALKKNPTDINEWLNLGLWRKSIGDYEGARDIWEYLKLVNPNDVVAYHNLGDLYHFFLKDYKKSEENWKKTISIKPDYVHGYRGLYELYSYSMKEKSTEIPVILKQGIAKNPQATDLQALLDEYNKSLEK